MAKLQIQRALKKTKLSRRQFAKRLKKDYKNIWRAFLPAHNPSWNTLNEYAKAIGCKVRDLFRE